MDVLDLKQMGALSKVVAEEKNLTEEAVIDIIEQAVAAAWRRDNGEREQNVRAVLNLNTGEATVYVMREVIEEGLAYNPATEIPESEAKKLKKDAKIGDIVEESFTVTTLGRVASQTAKQVMMQKLREAEREAVFVLFEDKIGTVMTGTVARVEPKIVKVDLGKVIAIMPQREQIMGEFYKVGSRIKVFVKGIERDETKADLIVSRGGSEFIEWLFRQEVPEIETGAVEIKGIAREAGRRTKIAVASNVAGVDPVGTFVGGRGVRVQAVMAEVGEREKIDIVSWSDNVSEFIREALSPAEIQKVELDEKNKRAKVFVTEDQQSIAIGKVGQNVRLASQLTGYELDIELAQKAPKRKTSKGAEDSLMSVLSEVAE
ncbi:MAG: transcription termination factor NusA [Candidatus Nomurabacteria bacterium]|jgi:N utilization substance protein A|nr:transcription termination factor NusA [Candidatus Nomurabacteria bacterium]